MRAALQLAVISAWVGLCACGSEFSGGEAIRKPPSEDKNDDGKAGGSPDSGLMSGTDSPTDLAPVEEAPPANMTPKGCGDGTRTEDEACDDGNREGGDGCGADCLGIEAGFACSPPGKPCRVIARCGDGIVASSEECDDGNSSDSDGCSARCKLEPGTKCDGEPSKCSPTTCGDGKREGSESCDDGNKVPFDGCAATCQAEPNCKDGACSSNCGDGLVLNEGCDDGNLKDGDGCSSKCETEQGFTCEAQSTSESIEGGKLRVSALFRDFSESHPDFGIGCDGIVRGVVQDRLNADGKPVLANGGNACIQSAETFGEWYTSNANNATIVGEITLFDNGKGGYVNRYGPNGEQWTGPQAFTNVVYGGPAGSACAMCAPSGMGQCFDPCTPWNDNGQSCCGDAMPAQVYDGSPLFFPIDESPAALTDMRYRAKVPEQYGYNGWPFEDTVNTGAGTHDFYFTTEVVYWFEYKADTNAVLDFTGDDDVWVFVNRRLAVDLGGAHVPENGSVTIDAANAARFDLKPNNVYELRVLHAERKLEGSSFRLTLSGFDTNRSDCTPKCGDGIVTLGEECDDGVNDGGYEECAPGCVLGARCGDNQVQEGEDCDDGNRRDGDSCGSSCRELMLL